ncbi:MAG: glycosyltransferase [Puia sp.]|nr:glycosyltransferase [Puia sp.]
MEIIHVLMGKINPARLTGVGRLVHELAIQQSNSGARVSLWGLTRAAHHDYPGTQYDTFLFKSHGDARKLDKRLVQAIVKKKNDSIFHLHGGFNPAFYSLVKVLRRYRIPYVFSPHGSYDRAALKQDRLRKFLYLHLFERKIWKYAETIHCLGQKEADRMQKLCPNKKTVLIRYGYEKGEVTSPSLPAGNSHFVVGYCGRLDIREKGLDALMKGFALFQKSVPSARLWISGNGRGKVKLEKMAVELGIVRKVRFLDWQFGKEKLALLCQMQVVAQPSRYEDLPATILEAASMGIPSLVTQATNMGDAVRRYGCGEVINSTEASSVSDALSSLYHRIQGGGTAELRENAQRMIVEEFNWKSVLHDFEQLYEVA